RHPRHSQSPRGVPGPVPERAAFAAPFGAEVGAPRRRPRVGRRGHNRARPSTHPDHVPHLQRGGREVDLLTAHQLRFSSATRPTRAWAAPTTSHTLPRVPPRGCEEFPAAAVREREPAAPLIAWAYPGGSRVSLWCARQRESFLVDSHDGQIPAACRAPDHL